MPSIARLILLAALAPAWVGCFTAGYLAQAAKGEAEMLHGARPLREVIDDRSTPERVRELLARVDGVKAWGQGEGLKPTPNYTRYTELHRPAAVWVVQACAPLAFEVKRWSFPLIGSVPYLGFFDEGEAQRFAERVAASETLDVDVRTASAYSTLGWFRDPVLSTMLSGGEEALGDLVEVVLHESVHATLYVPSQSSFNESLASFVGDRLTRQWLAAHLGEDAKATKAWLAAQERHERVVGRLHGVYVELDSLYRSARSDEEKRAEKARILASAREELGLRRPLNNAMLAGYETYGTGHDAFGRLFAVCGSWPRFLSALSTLGPADFGKPQQEDFDPAVEALGARGCRGAGGPTPRERARR